MLKKIWHFIWEEDSIWSWLANIIIAFLLIKFIVYPSLGLILGTNYPIVAVVSGSMEHPQNTFENWWSTQCCTNLQCTTKKSQTEIYEKWRINKETYTTFPFTSGFNKGDIMVLTSPKELEKGDVLVFTAQDRADPIIHRMVNVNTIDGKTFYNTQGDNNCGSTAEFEKNLPQERLLGKAYFKVPLLGWLKILFVELLKIAKVM